MKASKKKKQWKDLLFLFLLHQLHPFLSDVFLQSETEEILFSALTEQTGEKGNSGVRQQMKGNPDQEW